jgi:large subunit ribosomal protein L24
VEKEMPVDPSNIMLFNPQISKGDRIGFRFLEDGRKVRYFKSNNEVVDV